MTGVYAMRFISVFGLLLAMQAAAWAGEDPQVAAGRKLLADNNCNGACHKSHSPDGNPLSLYTRPNHKVKSFSQLTSQVGRCVANTNAMISPDEIGDVAAALNHDYYKFQRK
jgi:hypothetical protein